MSPVSLRVYCRYFHIYRYVGMWTSVSCTTMHLWPGGSTQCKAQMRAIQPAPHVHRMTPHHYFTIRKTSSKEAGAKYPCHPGLWHSWRILSCCWVVVVFRKEVCKKEFKDFLKKNPGLYQKAKTVWERPQLFYSKKRPWTTRDLTFPSPNWCHNNGAQRVSRTNDHASLDTIQGVLSLCKLVSQKLYSLLFKMLST